MQELELGDFLVYAMKGNGRSQYRGGMCRKARAVMQYGKGGKIRRRETIAEASRALGIARGSISSCCSGRSKSAGGFSWEYLK